MVVSYRISTSLALLLGVFAIIADLIQFILGFLWLTVILGIVAYGISLLVSLTIYTLFGLIFISKGVKPFSGRKLTKKIGVFGGTFLFKFIPLIGQFTPSLSIWTYFTMRESWKEDKENAQKKALEDAKIERAQRLIAQRRRERRRRQEIASLEEV